jgi:hypothetical protein
MNVWIILVDKDWGNLYEIPKIANPTNVGCRNISHNQLDGTLDAFLGSLTDIIGITNLDISYNKFSRNVSSSFHNLNVGLSMLWVKKNLPLKWLDHVFYLPLMEHWKFWLFIYAMMGFLVIIFLIVGIPKLSNI